MRRVMGSEMKHKEIKTMKKILIVLLAALLALVAVACKANEQPKAAENEEPKAAAQEAAVNEEIKAAEENEMTNEPLAGGWTPAEDFGDITVERRTVFDKGMAVISSIHTPLAYLGSQVVAGTNHCFLSKGSNWLELVYLYEDLRGNVQLMNIAQLPIVPQADGTLTVPEAGLSGGWYYAEDPAFTDEDEAKLEAALQSQVGASYTIVAYVGEQVVAGLNRCLLCQVKPVVPNAQPHYALAYVYTDLEGNSSLSQVIDLDVGAYCTYGA